nr:hypothetical protein [uncultured Helicobacter sp.]
MEQNIEPTPQGDTPPNEPQNKEQMLEAMQNELNQAMQSLESDFAKKCVSLCENDPQLEELFFSDKEQFFLKILEYQNQVFKEEIEPRQEKVANLQGEIEFDNKMQELDSAKAQWDSQNPPVSADELLAFFTTLPQEVQKELEALPSESVFPTLLEIMQSQNPQEQTQDLPQQVNGSPANVSSNEPQSDLPTQRY